MKTISNLNKSMIEEILSEIQISESKYEEAEKRYKAIGNWLNREDSLVARFNPKVYAQGSFLLGTAIKPTTIKDEYDVDIVGELGIKKISISQSALKKMIGSEVKAYAKSQNMYYEPTEGKRCWTLIYADGTKFHVDVLPAVPDNRLLMEFRNDIRVHPNWLESAIAITDRTHKNFDKITQDWPVSNPKGYFQWFKEQMEVQFEEKSRALIEAYQGEVEEMPFYKVRTPLQNAIQLLKYHRDVLFEKDNDKKPISIIITTLAANSYNNEADLVEALVNIAANIRRFINKDIYGNWEIINPVNPKENFAEKWANGEEGVKLTDNFFKWLNRVEEDFSVENLTKETEPLYESFQQGFGIGIAAKALEKVASKEQIPVSRPAPKVNISAQKPWLSRYS